MNTTFSPTEYIENIYELLSSLLLDILMLNGYSSFANSYLESNWSFAMGIAYVLSVSGLKRTFYSSKNACSMLNDVMRELP